MNRKYRAAGQGWLPAVFAIALAHGQARAAEPPPWVEAARDLPTPEWARGSDALVLEDSQVVTVSASGRVVTRTRWAVRLLGPTGADAAERSAVYLRGSSQVKAMDAWEFSAAGDWTHLGDKDATDVSAAGSWSLYSDVRFRTLSATNPVPGTVFASETLVDDAPLFEEFFWNFDGQRPCLRSSLTLCLPPGVEPLARDGTGRKARMTREGRNWTWEQSDLPPRIREPLSPRRGDDGSQVYVTLRAAAEVPRASMSMPSATFSAWPEVSQWLDRIEAPQCVITPAITEHVRTLLGAELDTLRRMNLLARAVQRTNYVSLELGLSRGWGYRPHPADQVLAAGYGDCKDKSNLLCALLRAAGHEAWMVAAYSGSRHHVVPERPTPSQFNHCIVAMRVPQSTTLPAAFRHPTLGTVLAFDPTDPLTGFGDLPVDEQGSLVLFGLPDGCGLVRLPVLPPESSRFDRVVWGTLSDDGTLVAQLEERARGQGAVPHRRLRRDSDLASYRRSLERWLAADRSSVELRSFRTEEDSLSGEFDLLLEYSAPGFGRALGPRMLSVRPAAVTLRPAFALRDSSCTLAIQLSAECFRESVTVAMPAGMRPEELPVAVDRTTDFGRLHAEWTFADGFLRFVRSQTVATSLLPAERYADVRTFYALSNKVRNTPVVLLRY